VMSDKGQAYVKAREGAGYEVVGTVEDTPFCA
jgi:hypothetical protein